MATPTDEDWRLNGQESFLLGVELTRADYVPPSPTWDHDHCEFCWAKFMDKDGPDIQRTGYNKLVDEILVWICNDCFGDFKKRFRWTVNSEETPD